VTERYEWDSLPPAVRDRVEARLGEVTPVESFAHGQNNDLAVAVRTKDAMVVLKGVKGVSLRMRWLRNEVTASEIAVGLAPATLFSLDVERDWLVVATEYVAGRPADLSQGSDDLGLVARTVAAIGSLEGGEAPRLAERWAAADWWTRLRETAPDEVGDLDLALMERWSERAAEAVDGSALLHTDLHEHQFVVVSGADIARVLDWGRPASGASWVDVAFLVVRLVAAGHSPREAERWAESVPGWAGGGDGVTAFACYVAGLWGFRGATAPFPGAAALSAAARIYALYRLAATPSAN
jgi:hypothetical protein